MCPARGSRRRGCTSVREEPEQAARHAMLRLSVWYRAHSRTDVAMADALGLGPNRRRPCSVRYFLRLAAADPDAVSPFGGMHMWV